MAPGFGDAMPHIFVDPPASWSFELPLRLRLCIADAIIVFSRIDHAVIEILWANEQADLAQKKVIAKRSANDNIATLRATMDGLPGADYNAIWGALERLRNDRNIIGHSVWMVDDKYIPWAVWHSKFLESKDYVVGEQFSYDRFEEIMRVAAHLLGTMLELKTMLEDMAAGTNAEGKWPPPEPVAQ